MSFVSKLKDIIFQDVQNENETKKTAVSLRINAIIMGLYFIFLCVTFLTERKTDMGIISGACFVLYAIAFRLTYLNHTKSALWFAEILSIAWIVTFVYQLGWDCGVQHFIFVLILMIFTPGFISNSVKLIHSVFLFVTRMGLFMYARNFPAIKQLPSDVTVVLQVMNTFFIFLALVAGLLLFTYDSAQMEEKLMKYNKKLHKLASEDPLTGLMNRRSILTKVQKYQAENREDIGPCVAIGDLDHFKRINDTYSHDAGDEVLKAAADFFTSFMNGKGYVGRWGGEEFLFVFPNCNLDEAKIYLLDLLKELRKIEIPYNDQVIRFTMTVGAEECGGEDIEKTINAADNKLYMGKESGRDKVVC